MKQTCLDNFLTILVLLKASNVQKEATQQHSETGCYWLLTALVLHRRISTLAMAVLRSFAAVRARNWAWHCGAFNIFQYIYIL